MIIVSGLDEKAMSLSVFNPSICHLWPFLLVLCHCFKAMLLVVILP